MITRVILIAVIVTLVMLLTAWHNGQEYIGYGVSWDTGHTDTLHFEDGSQRTEPHRNWAVIGPWFVSIHVCGTMANITVDIGNVPVLSVGYYK